MKLEFRRSRSLAIVEQRRTRNDMEPLAVTVATARELTGLGNTKIFELLASGQLYRVKVGRRTLITTKSIRALIERV